MPRDAELDQNVEHKNCQCLKWRHFESEFAMLTCILLARLGWHMMREKAGAQFWIRYDGTGVARDVQQPLGKWISCAPLASANLTKNEFLPYKLYGGNDFELHRIVGAMLPSCNGSFRARLHYASTRSQNTHLSTNKNVSGIPFLPPIM